ncbi:MAG: TerB family tellurite resistance protein [Bacteroidetes bacterium]|nr:MAG: TerB family tellurite resistance protein [Bacteroidota bacterium]
MKRYLVIISLLFGKLSFSQSDEAQQLLLNWEKLTQFKVILQQMKDGYQILDKGYNTIKNISEGSFSLHKTFLDGLLEVSPLVKKYKRVADIIEYQVRIIKEYKSAFEQFKKDKQFTAAEIEVIRKVYVNLLIASVKNIDLLTLVVTSGELRMSDGERLEAIDEIYNGIVDQYTFLNEFNNNTAILSIQREKEKMDIDLMKKVHGY